MKALFFDRFQLESLQLVERPDPIPQPDEVIIRVHAASLNPSDVKNVQGKMEGATLPRIPGRDFAGVVEAGPAEWKGKAVWGTGGDIGFTRNGTHAEKIALPLDALVEKPDALSFDQAASLGVNFLTALLCLDALALTQTDTLLITGASGGVGSAAIQLAKARGAKVIAADRNQQASHESRSTGADLTVVVEEDHPDELPFRIRDLTNSSGATAALDCVGGPLFEPCLKSLAHDGRQVNITSVGSPRVSFNLADFYHHRLTLKGVDSRALDAVQSAHVLRQLIPGFKSGALHSKATLIQIPLTDGTRAYERLNQGQLMGKAVFVMSDQKPA